jgi:hypothetical protein
MMETPLELLDYQLKIIETAHGPMNSHYEGYTRLKIALDEIYNELRGPAIVRERFERKIIDLAAWCINMVNEITRDPHEGLIQEILKK